MNCINIDLEDLKIRNKKEVIKKMPKNGMTSKELAEVWNVSQRTAQKRVKEMVEKDTAYLSGYTTFKKTDGTIGHSPLYVIGE